MIFEVRDESAEKDDAGEPVDPGVRDKRLMILDGELGSALRAMNRPGNTLGTALRTAWDGNDLSPMTKNQRIRASQPHIGITAHITRLELINQLGECEIWGGTGNRFLWYLLAEDARSRCRYPLTPALWTRSPQDLPKSSSFRAPSIA